MWRSCGYKRSGMGLWGVLGRGDDGGRVWGGGNFGVIGGEGEKLVGRGGVLRNCGWEWRVCLGDEE